MVTHNEALAQAATRRVEIRSGRIHSDTMADKTNPRLESPPVATP
jgi:ABC-type lipoprotein export system ATPase subunit